MKLKRLISALLASVCALTMGVAGMSASAAPVAEATIDTTKTASLDIYKYDITAAKTDGVWDEDNYTSTGVRDQTGVENVLGNGEKTLPNGDKSYGYAIKGVEFTYLKIADISTYTKGGVTQVLYGFDKTGTGETALKALGLSWTDRVTEADTATTYYFASETLIDGLKDSLAANATTVKDALEAYVKGSGTAMTQTDGYGHTSATALPLGLYLVVETKVPEYVTTTTAPFLVSLPMTSVNGTNATDGGTRWMYDVTVYPKNETGNPDLEKTVREAKNDTGKNNGLTNDITDGYAHTATGSDGDVLDYQIISKLPTITSAASNLTTYTFVDTLSQGLSYNKDVTLEWYKDAACTEKIATWAETDNKFTATYGAGENGASTMTIAMTDTGLAEINSGKTVWTADGAVQRGYSDCTLRIVYSATLHSDATVTYGDSGNPNTVTLTWKRTSTSYYDTLTDDCHVYTYGIDLLKQFSDNRGDFAKVTFALHNDTDGYYVKANLVDGVYYVTDHVAAEADATPFVPTADGHIVIKGLEDDAYTATELTTDNGYKLLRDDIQIVIRSDEGETLCDVCGKALRTASATVNGDTVEMAADNGSVHAVAQLTVINHRGFSVPKTGETGTWLLVGGGTAVAALGMILLCVLLRRRKDSEEA